MTLSAVMAVILRYYTEVLDFKANRVKLVEAEPKLSTTEM